MTAPLLRIEGLDLSIGQNLILDDVGLSVREAEIHGIVGESGSGKSLTALTVMRLLPQGSRGNGIVEFNGRDLLAATEPEMCRLRGRDIGMVFQEPMTALNPVKTIGQQIAEGLIWHLRISRADAEQRTLALLDRVGLDPAKITPNRFPHQLSGGQRQRVVIAIAIALNPRLIIADEPTTALDVTIQAQILELLKGIVAEHNSALILISHDLAVVADMADHVTIMRRGTVVEAGETEKLFQTLAHPYSKMLVEASTHQPNRTPDAVSGEPLLQVRDLVRTYPLPKPHPLAKREIFTAVDGVSFDINRGESLGLVGESGCGKSTLARTILALDAPQSGSVTLDGEDVFGLDDARLAEQRGKMSVVFQDPYGSFNPRHKVKRLVAEPLHLLPPMGASEVRDRVSKALTDVGLTAADMDKYPHEFSGGQRQRLAIARALITEPALVVADEPVSALDVSIRAQILDLFADLQARLGLAMLFISHDLTVVRAITDRVMIMKAGRVIEEGETASVFEEPSEAYTRELLAAVPRLD
ncbi:MAG: dipeptide ABC transporter ATP-binding protein [Pseudomonadota bacterium]